ncbi:MAG TPA: DMT family transporter [Pyrinomonadaceae bacterium]|jgi:drug/metabolite transporter (DMT)-like permease|nr:DMT family transporter [Pyrinomonadaceae bacterium]
MSQRFKPHLALITVQILFGIWPIFGKIVLRSMSSTSLVVLRLAGAAVLFAILQRRLTPLLRMPVKDIVVLTACSLLGIVGNQFLFVKGLSLTTVINAEILSTTIPVYAIATSILLGYERGSLKTLVGVLFSVAGVVYLVNPFHADLSTHTTTGNVLILVNSFLYALYIVISKNLVGRYGALNVVTWIFLIGSVITVPVGIYSLQRENLAAVGAGTWAAVAFIIVFPTVIAYYLNAWALTRVPPSVVAIYIYLQPLIAFGFAPLLLGESWSWRTIAAAILIFGGVTLVTRDTDRRIHVSV